MNYLNAQRKLAPLLKPAAAAYSGIMRLRERAYAHKIIGSQKPESFCVAVGNISWGGSGKTPLTDWLLSWAENRGLLPAVLTRGYGGESETRPLVVKPHTPPDESGDEPLMLAQAHPGAFILADPSRRRALDWLNASTKANFIVLDDGMQHLAVQRDLNLVLLRPKDLGDEWGKVIPAGSWREGPNALKRADAFMLRLNGEDFTALAEKAKKRLAQFERPLFSFDLLPAGLKALGHATESEHGESILRSLNNSPYALCTAVGTPESVRKTAASLLGYAPAEEFIYPDHYKFTPQDIRQMAKHNLPLVTTTKDAVKMRPLLANEIRLHCFVLESTVSFGPVLFTDKDFPGWFAAAYSDKSYS